MNRERDRGKPCRPSCDYSRGGGSKGIDSTELMWEVVVVREGTMARDRCSWNDRKLKDHFFLFASSATCNYMAELKQ